MSLGRSPPRQAGEGREENDAQAGSPAAFVVHSLAHAVAALEAAVAAGREAVLLSAAEAGISAGPGWFRELIAAARAAVPGASPAAYLDCGDDAGAAQAAIRAAVDGIVFTGSADVATRLAAIAVAQGARFATIRPDIALDLGESLFADAGTLRARCADALASPRPIC